MRNCSFSRRSRASSTVLLGATAGSPDVVARAARSQRWSVSILMSSRALPAWLPSLS
jgi:hypothetical protein